MDYRTTLIDSREGVNLTVQEAKQMAAIIAPLLKQGQSPYQIVTNHPELDISEKNALQLYRKRCFPRDCGDHCHGFAEAGITQTAEEKGKNL